jgi:hypothetical protein
MFLNLLKFCRVQLACSGKYSILQSLIVGCT